MPDRVFLKLYYPLDEYVNMQSGFSLDWALGMTVKKLLAEIGVPLDAVGFAVINGEMVNLNVIVQSGDKITIFPLINGG